MQQFEGKTAVVTGAASGIGRALAERFAAARMRVVLADIEEAPLRETEEALLERGAEAIAVRTDVRARDSVEELQRRATEAFGRVHVLCNNAGVGTGGLSWEQSDDDWQWVLGVNLWGVIHGVRTFLPAMLAHGEEAHIVNTASVAGLIAGPFQGSYNVSKFGVVALSETLYYELQMAQAKVGISVLCPGFVNTRIVDSGRNRPAEFGAPGVQGNPDDPAAIAMRQMIAAGMTPADVAERVFEAVAAGRLYVLPHDDFDAAIRARVESVLERRNPGGLT
ncbi:MAG: SDR family NAD(P)-dependent oxidoreductase [Dehalococcoidia bacterium]|nr:SDR family NAD(P)-dependent oxidoreductase [Dehalococcoidia bacterium]